MTIQDIDDKYDALVKEAEERYLEKLSSGKDRDKAESAFKERLAAIRKVYEHDNESYHKDDRLKTGFRKKFKGIMHIIDKVARQFRENE